MNNNIVTYIFERAIDKLSPKIEEKTGLTFRNMPKVEVGGLEVIIPHVERRISAANQLAHYPKSLAELKVDSQRIVTFFLEDVGIVYDSVTDVIVINDEIKNSDVSFGELAYFLVTSLQHQEAKDTILPFELDVIKNPGQRLVYGVSICGQRIYISHEVMDENRSKDPDYEDGFKKTSKAMSLSVSEIVNRVLFVKDLKDANCLVGNSSNIGYKDLIKNEVDYVKLINELDGLLNSEDSSKLSLRDHLKVLNVFDNLNRINLVRQIGYQFNQDMANAGISAYTIMAQVPSLLSQVNVGFYR